jgi:amino acid transporter
MSMQAAPPRQSPVSRQLARDRIGQRAVLSFLLAAVAPLTVAAGLITSAYSVTGLTGLPPAFLVIPVVLAVFAAGYMAMARHITNAGAFYAFIAAGLGRVPGTAAAVVALASYSCLQIALYGMIGPYAATQAAAHLSIAAPWWVWALAAWALVSVLGLARVDITGKVLGVLTGAEILVILALTVTGLTHPAGGHLSFAPLSPAGLTSGGWGTAGVLAVIAVLGCSGFEQAPILGEEVRRPRRTIPAATFTALALIAVMYGGSAWAMAAHAGVRDVAAVAGQQGPGLMFGLAGGFLSQAAQWLFLTSLFAAATAFHNAVWRYCFALGREGVLPGALGRTGANSIPKAASLAQSGTALAVIIIFAALRLSPMTWLFFAGGTSGGFGILLLLAVTSAAVIAFFARNPRGETAWSRLIAPAISGVILAALAVLAVWHYATLLGVPPDSPAAWALPAAFAVITVAGLIWGLALRAFRPEVYAAIGMGAYTTTAATAPVTRPGTPR